MQINNERSSGKQRRWLWWAIPVIFLLVSLGGALAWLDVSGQIELFRSSLKRHPHESTAVYVGPDAGFYASMNFRPGNGVLRDWKELFDDVMEDEGVAAAYDDWVEELKEETGASDDDLFLTFGPELAVAVYPPDAVTGEAEYIAFVGIMDEEEARRILLDLLEIQAEEYGQVEALTVAGFDAYRHEFQDTVYAFVDEHDYIVISDSESVIAESVGMMSHSTENLSDVPDFQRLRAEVPEGRVGFFYSSPDLFAESALQTAEDFGYPADLGSADIPTIAGALTVRDRSVRLDVVGSTDDDIVSTGYPGDVIGMVPVDAVAFLGWSFSWSDALTQSQGDPDFDESLDDFKNSLKEETGLDLERDIVAPLGDQSLFALTGLRVRDDGFGGSEIDSDSIGVVAMFEISDVETAERTLERLREYSAEYGVPFSQLALDDSEAWLLEDDSGAADDLGIEPGYALINDFLVVFSDVGTALNVEDVAGGSKRSILESDAYSRAVDQAGAGDSIMYLDVEQVVAVVEAVADLEEDPYYEDSISPWLREVQSFIMTGSVNEEMFSITFALTLR